MRLIFGGIVLVISVLAFTSVLLIVRLTGLHPRFGARVTRRWARVMLWGYGVRRVMHTPEGLDDGPFVIVANHASMMDIGTMAASMPMDFHFLSRPFFFKIPVMGWGMYAAGHFSIPRDNPREAKKVLAKLTARFETGLSACLFPEGTRSPDGTVGCACCRWP